MNRVKLAAKLFLLFATLCVGISIVVWIRSLAADSAISEPPPQPKQPVDIPQSTPTPENTSLADKSPQYLCDHLADLKQMAWDSHDHSGDAVYDGLKRNGYYAMTCLAEKLTDTTSAENPTGAPFMSGYTYRLGDTAMFMLMDISEMNWPRGMMPEKYERMFKTEGMFAYFEYVHSVPGSRKKVQQWWRNWIKTCRPECRIIPSLEN